MTTTLSEINTETYWQLRPSIWAFILCLQHISKCMWCPLLVGSWGKWRTKIYAENSWLNVYRKFSYSILLRSKATHGIKIVFFRHTDVNHCKRMLPISNCGDKSGIRIALYEKSLTQSFIILVFRSNIALLFMRAPSGSNQAKWCRPSSGGTHKNEMEST